MQHPVVTFEHYYFQIVIFALFNCRKMTEIAEILCLNKAKISIGKIVLRKCQDRTRYDMKP